jgi:hypothetical protein
VDGAAKRRITDEPLLCRAPRACHDVAVPTGDVDVAVGRPTAFWVGRVLKVSLFGLLLLPLLKPDLEQYEGKGMSWRILVYPLACFVVPVLWRTTGSRAPYPYLADNLLVLMPLTDVLWNTLDAYDRVWAWDKANHFANSILVAAVVGLLASRYRLRKVSRFALAFGLGMTLQVLWEVAEYTSFAFGWSEAQGWGDTIGDLAFDLVGSLVGAGFALLAASAGVESLEAETAVAYAGR